jgi:hypothetical protein
MDMAHDDIVIAGIKFMPCEALLKEMIIEMKAEIAAEKVRLNLAENVD